MNYNDENIDLVEKFVDGNMNDQEVKKFSEQLANDQALNRMCKREKSIISGIRQTGLEKDLLFLRKLETTLSKEPIRLNTRWYYAAAAAVIVILMSYWIVNGNTATSEELYISYFKPYPSLNNASTRGGGEQDDRTTAVQAYENQQYDRALILFNSLLKQKSDPEILLLLGNTNLILGNIAEAKKNFITLSEDYDMLDVQAKWYLSLCYLKEGDRESARQALKELSATEISYAERAKELLRKVD